MNDTTKFEFLFHFQEINIFFNLFYLQIFDITIPIIPVHAAIRFNISSSSIH
jgi:hypothetical protein